MSETKEIVKKFEPKFKNIDEVNTELKGKKIDLRKTIEKIVSNSGWIASEYLICIDKCLMDLSKEMKKEYNIELYTDEFYDKLEELKNEGKSIYISTVYASDEDYGSEIIYEYKIGDEYATSGINSCIGNFDLRLDSKYYLGDIAADNGIMIENDEISFYRMNSGQFGSLDPITDLSEPLNELVIELMLEIIEFED